MLIVCRELPKETLGDIAQAVYDGGARFLEITFNQCSDNPGKEFECSVDAIRKRMGDKLHLGAGTVLTAEQAHQACEMGAEYIVSPTTSVSVIEETKKMGLISIPGAATPTEVELAWSSGGDYVKIFPCSQIGIPYIKEMRAPLRHVKMLASGGVNIESIPEMKAVGIEYFATGMSVVKQELIRQGNFEEMAHLTKLHLEAINK